MLQRLALALIKIYQRHIRIIVPPSCRFTPTCSEFTRAAITKYGFLKGALKGLKRLCCCHPFSGKSGYDPLA
ncbi:MAG: membrane protein insertion efficiency factor YidD [Candidatus Omnitrophica bacterium]|nr:membrane protein insertion efficiency factor YidD [Candidatus Omnitrophota bacterium]